MDGFSGQPRPRTAAGWLFGLTPVVLLSALLLAGCGAPAPDSDPGLAGTERALQASQTALAEAERPAGTPQPTGTPPDSTPTSGAPDSPATAVGQACADLADQVGSTVTCVIPQAHCSYREDIDGAPTFCNDAPFPNHDFTLLVWGQDWSDFDGRCLVVSGFLSRFEGQPQIVAESRSQISFCD